MIIYAHTNTCIQTITVKKEFVNLKESEKVSIEDFGGKERDKYCKYIIPS